MSQSCQYTRLQRFCQVFAQTQGRRHSSVAVRNNQVTCWNACIMNVMNTTVPTSKIHRLCIPLCAKLHTSCRSLGHNSGGKKDYYKILNLKTNASASEIKEAYFKLSKKHHPDLNEGSTSTAAFLDISEAYTVLGKESTRQEYDDSIFHKNTDQQQNNFDYDKFHSRAKYWHESEAYGKPKKMDPKDFDPLNFSGENRKMKPEVPTTVDHVITVFMCTLAVLIVCGISYRFGETSKKNVRDPSVKVKKLESGVLVTTVDLTKQDSASQHEKKI
ncbi:uncharacterized protein LOC110453030 [Mizuhopecten yessoensis]|uniref:DnaJ-like dnj-10 n=1 Tax=Mizuhopecten yessoensis TaxID=6573 RepID=A0A210R6Y2_MIZYE|nr:uncharacterized protein LOC110453030 [Mizuhopecten yessoensis]XP_021357633.1 uncharacterized protein LOC110453030 [Mizuhopecten yessoensis]XP_021357707.1 uncharacterized protein LOC110453030 [Mizuhopecten yessoensis]XP_021357779.1 uncharacterized protein LOC110453030 [Mizuhopecten yessoensis]OWF56803.1 DnaJ-like dnj-10 [Mizuhopecten yessoensis]